MKLLTFVCSLSSGLLIGMLVSAAFPPTCEAAEPPLEKRTVFGPESAPQWSAPESAVETAAEPSRTGLPVLHWHITVDHFAGEPKYPIGWPRANCALRDTAARDWSDWDYFEFWVFTDTTRAALPRDPVGLALHTPDKQDAYMRPLSELKKGEWVQVRIPLSQVPRREDVRLMQIHISESNYRHQDQLDFYFDEIALLRYAQPTLLDLAAESEVMFADSQQLAVKFQLAGVKAEDRVEVVCALRRDGNAVARTAAACGRGPQRMTIDLSRVHLAPGDDDVSREYFRRRAELEYADMAAHGTRNVVLSCGSSAADAQGKFQFRWELLADQIELGRKHGFRGPLVMHISTEAVYAKYVKVRC